MCSIRVAAMSRPLRSSRTDKQGHVPQQGIVDNGVFLNVLIIIAVQDAMKRRLKAEGSLRQCSGNDRNRIEPDGKLHPCSLGIDFGPNILQGAAQYAEISQITLRRIQDDFSPISLL